MLRSKLLRELYQQHTLSRADLTRITGASSASVTGIVRELLQEGVVTEQGMQQDGLGRPRVMLCLNPTHRYVIGLRMVSAEVTGSLMDLRGNSLAVLSCQLPDFQVETVLEHLRLLTQRLMQQANIQTKQVLGVGLALSGIVDVRRRVCVHSFLLDWQNVPIGVLLEHQLQLPVVIENDVNSITIAQKLFAEATEQQYFAVLYLDEGIGMGFYHEDRMLTGQNNAAGEVGHFTVVRNGRQCICGKKGCLQAYASSGALVQQAREAGLDVDSTSDLTHLADQEDPEAVRLLTFAGQLVGLALSFVVDALDIRHVLVYAPAVSTSGHFQSALSEALQHHSLPLVPSSKTVLFKDQDPDLWLSGAGGIVIHAFLNEQIPTPAPLDRSAR